MSIDSLPKYFKSDLGQVTPNNLKQLETILIQGSNVAYPSLFIKNCLTCFHTKLGNHSIIFI